MDLNPVISMLGRRLRLAVIRGGPGTLSLAARSSRIVAGHPDGYHEGFANICSDAAEAISARRSGNKANALALYFPNSWHGLSGRRFVNSVIESSKASGKWTKCYNRLNLLNLANF